MKYHYQKPDISVPVYGKNIKLEHPVYAYGTLYLDYGRGIIVTQQHFDQINKKCIWSYVDPDIANDIYLSPNFLKFFKDHATSEDFPVFELRKLMWALRIKPLPRESWEDYFNR